MFIYKPKSVCASEIRVEINKDIIEDVEFVRGCPGNLIGIASLVKGMDINEAITKLSGIPCGTKSTSCPDQLAKALEQYRQTMNKK